MCGSIFLGKQVSQLPSEGTYLLISDTKLSSFNSVKSLRAFSGDLGHVSFYFKKAVYAMLPIHDELSQHLKVAN